MSKHGYSAQQRQDMLYDRQAINQTLLNVRNDRAAVRRHLEAGITPTSNSPAGFIGVKLNLTPDQQAALNDEIRRFKAGVWEGYGTPGSRREGIKGGLLPLLALVLSLTNFGDAWRRWREAQTNPSLKEFILISSALSSPTSAALSIYQSFHIATADHALKATMANTANQSGRLFQVRIGRLALGLGAVISPLAFLGVAGPAWNNLSNWHDASLRGTSEEQVGALLALIGDAGTAGVSGAQTVKAGRELFGLLNDVRGASILHAADPLQIKRAATTAWATRGARFINYSARFTPIGLAFAAFQIGGEALYNYANLNDQQRWMLGSAWGVQPQNWDWDSHAQKLAEATLLPTITDRGVKRLSALSEPFRSLHLVLPGLTTAALEDSSIRWAARWQLGSDVREVGEGLSQMLSIASTSPLTIELAIPDDWQRHQAILHLQLAVRPAMTKEYLRANKGYLHYRVPLGQDSINQPANPLDSAPDNLLSLPQTLITRELFNGRA